MMILTPILWLLQIREPQHFQILQMKYQLISILLGDGFASGGQHGYGS